VNAPPRLGDAVTLHYRLACAGHEIVNTFNDRPDRFTLGHNEIDPRIETLVLGLSPGQHHVFQLPPEQAFGLRDESLVHNIPRSEFPPDAQLCSGHSVEFPLPNGDMLVGTILRVDGDTVEIDFNHPLAGLPIELEIELFEISRTARS
jgi:FKBP-type peptidyl-prolyl cis-trans isomerase SlpA